MNNLCYLHSNFPGRCQYQSLRMWDCHVEHFQCDGAKNRSLSSSRFSSYYQIYKENSALRASIRSRIYHMLFVYVPKPHRPNGIAFSWMGEGFSKPQLAKPSSTRCDKPIWKKVTSSSIFMSVVRGFAFNLWAVERSIFYRQLERFSSENEIISNEKIDYFVVTKCTKNRTLDISPVEPGDDRASTTTNVAPEGRLPRTGYLLTVRPLLNNRRV